MWILQRMEGERAAYLLKLVTIDLSTAVIEAFLAGALIIFAAFQVSLQWWIPVLLLGGASGLLLIAIVAWQRYPEHPVVQGVGVLMRPRYRWEVLFLLMLVFAAQIVRTWISLRSVDVPLDVGDALLVFVLTGVLGVLPTGVTAAPTVASLIVVGSHGVGPAAAAGILVTGSLVAATVLYCLFSVSVRFVLRRPLRTAAAAAQARRFARTELPRECAVTRRLWGSAAPPSLGGPDLAHATLSAMPSSGPGSWREPAVAARSVSKTFRIPEDRRNTLKERALHPRRRVGHHEFRALNDVSFEIRAGEFFGIAGRNGSGKSTLLKCLAGIYQADGDIWRRGRLSTLIELGVGFSPEMAARDNVVMNGIMLGLSPREARKRYESVIEFAELEEFKDLKLKNYSSGMHVRLAFSVAVQVDADILMVDEVLAVGDAAFQQKCFDVFNDLRDKGRTIVFVTHDMGALQRFCHRALLLERGNPVYIGEPHEVADRYLEINFGRDPQASGAASDGHAGDGEARIAEVWMENEAGERLTTAPQHQRVTLRARVLFMVEVVDPSASVYVYNEEHRAVVVATTGVDNERSGQFEADEEVVFSFTFDNVLAPGRYSPVFQLAHRGSGLDVIDRFEGNFSFVVTGPGALGGLVDLPVQSEVSRTGPAVAQRTRA